MTRTNPKEPTMYAIPDQPPPIRAHGDVWQELIDDEDDAVLRAWFTERRALGLERYGTPLQRANGRDHRVDLRQELLDALAYAQAARLAPLVVMLRSILIADATGALDALAGAEVNAGGDGAEALPDGAIDDGDEGEAAGGEDDASNERWAWTALVLVAWLTVGLVLAWLASPASV